MSAQEEKGIWNLRVAIGEVIHLGAVE